MDSGLLDTYIILSEKLQGVTGCTSSIIYKVLIFALKKDNRAIYTRKYKTRTGPFIRACII